MSNNVFNMMLSRIMAEKKKAVIVLCLAVIMVVMWVRSFTGKAQTVAEATATSNNNAAAPQKNAEAKVSFVELPYVEGRNDVLNRDFFAVKKLKTTEGENISVDPSGNESRIKQLMGSLKLEAIGMGKTPQAFINDKVYAVGDNLILEDHGNIYKFQIAGIEKGTVLIKYEQIQVKLKLTE